ncbi:hypothetical protein DL764_005809 [Monosporascus ibericus]|uniref:Uncharacterized protein n=1 Tax=Monosporascus ibericus TaxID=155417 RepID=A0A4Q4TAM6_9PEZI|nr:hypothetical protein DL764_005809 [Monosporascus ibericus]
MRSETLLQAPFRCEATDKRDMVFVFRGIADSRPVAQPNYRFWRRRYPSGSVSESKAIDVVDMTCPPFDSHSVARRRAAVAAVRALRRRLSDDVSEEVWMDRLVTTLVLGLNVGDSSLDERATLEYRANFREQFEWLHSSLSHEDLGKIAHK